MAPKTEQPLKHIEFVNLGPGRALVVMVTQSGQVENRVIDMPLGMPPSALVEASNYLNARLIGRTLEEARRLILEDLKLKRAELERPHRAGGRIGPGDLGRRAGQRADRARPGAAAGRHHRASRTSSACASCSTRWSAARASCACSSSPTPPSGVQIFIGADNPLFANTGCSMVVAPFRDSQERILGAIGVIGPTRLNYARIIPLVDYTARTIGRVVGLAVSRAVRAQRRGSGD